MNKKLAGLSKSWLPHSKREWLEFCLNIAVGVVAFLILLMFGNSEQGRVFVDNIFDSFIKTRLEWQTSGGGEKPDSWNKMVFFDIDKEAMQSMEHPELFPRGILAVLVQYAKDNDAKLVLIDFDLSAEDKLIYERSEETASFLEGISNEAGDKLLSDVLAKIENDQNTNTQVLIPKMSYSDQTAKNSFLTRSLGKTSNHIFWVSPHFYPADADPYLRFWAPYVEVKDAKGIPQEILWTMPFMSAALFQDTSKDDLNNLAEQLLELHRSQANGEKMERKAFPFPWRENECFHSVERVNGDIVLRPDERNRIAFDFLSDNSPLLATSVKFKKIPLIRRILNNMDEAVHDQIYHWRRNGSGTDIELLLPTKTGAGKRNIGYLHRASEGTRETSHEQNFCKDKIVIIGRSDEDGNDLFWTCVDRMPGMYVNGNAIATLLPHKGLELPHPASGQWFMLWDAIFLFVFSCITVKCSPPQILISTLVLPFLAYGGFFIWFTMTNTFVYAGVACFVVALFDTVNKPIVNWLEKFLDFT